MCCFEETEIFNLAELFELICQHDMEGIVGKWKVGHYDQPAARSEITLTRSE